MTNREKLARMSAEELGAFLCNIFDDIGEEAENGGYSYEFDWVTSGCHLCPVRNYCHKGTDGFTAYLNQEVEDED